MFLLLTYLPPPHLPRYPTAPGPRIGANLLAIEARGSPLGHLGLTAKLASSLIRLIIYDVLKIYRPTATRNECTYLGPVTIWALSLP